MHENLDVVYEADVENDIAELRKLETEILKNYPTKDQLNICLRNCKLIYDPNGKME